MNLTIIQAGLKRFAKGFIAGGIAQVVLIIGAGFQFHNLEDIRTYVTAILFGFVTGGLLAVEKMVNYTPPQLPTIDHLP
jgi:hypothetical protein